MVVAAGYCTDGEGEHDWYADQSYVLPASNAYETWAGKLARQLNADMMVEAVGAHVVLSQELTGMWQVSGYGILPSEWDSQIQNVMDYTNGFAQQQEWDYTSWTPDAVFILIGPNDDSSDASFEGAYLSFLRRVVGKYKHNQIGTNKRLKLVSICMGSMNGLDPCVKIANASAQFNAADISVNYGARSFLVEADADVWNRLNMDENHAIYMGCDSHYNSHGHATLVEHILPRVRDIMDWHSTSAIANVATPTKTPT